MAEPVLPEDLRDAPAPVRASALWIEQNRQRTRLFLLAMGLVAVVTCVVPSVGHDVLGWTEAQSLAFFLPGVLAGGLGGLYLMFGSLRHAAEHNAVVARFRELKRLGLVSALPPGGASGALDRLLERITALGASSPGLIEAAARARDRARSLGAELDHLDQTLEAEPDLRARLAGVRERVQSEIAEIRARLAETYAALLELDAAGQQRDALPEALDRLRAELELSSPDSRDAVRRAQAHARTTGS